jgi:hypothetical protein
MEHCPAAEQIADMWPKQLGPGPFLVFGGRFLGLDRSCVLKFAMFVIVSSR